MAQPEMVDWDLALRVGRSFGGPGPPVAQRTKDEIRTDFEEFVRLADGLVTSFTGLRTAEPVGAPRVLDRGGWVGVNIDGFRALLRPLAERLGEKGRRVGGSIAQKAIGLQIGLLLGYLSQKVLGQYDLLLSGGGAGRVYFVGPNVVAAERRWRFTPRDFRLWIALHEVTHRTQFVAVPWLRAHVSGLIERYLATAEMDVRRLREALESAAKLLVQGPQAWKRANMLTLFLTPAQREVVDQMQSLMTVVEGHGNFVMDRVGAERIPTYQQMREALTAQRHQASLGERTLQKAIGLDLKYAQYSQGEAFVAAVADSSGMDAVNIVWERAENLPSAGEIADPTRWLKRVLRDAPPAPVPG